jgi:CheY-like chemotaxis protein
MHGPDVKADATSPDTQAQPPRLRLLVAEDNPTNVKLMRIVLRGLGFECDVVSTGREVLEALRHGSYDLVFMDMRMPDMDGVEATRRVCSEWGEADRPRIVVVTAASVIASRQACLDAGADEILGKPASRAELQQAIERCSAELARIDALAVAGRAQRSTTG